MKSLSKVSSILVAGFFLLETALAPLALATKPAGQQDIGNYINTEKIASLIQVPAEQTFKELAAPAKLQNDFGPDSAVSERRKAKIISGLSNMPVNFIENKGQVNEKVKYYAKQRGAAIYFTADEIVFDFVREKKSIPGNSELEKTGKNSNAYYGKETRSKKEYERQVVRMKINGSNALAQITGINKLQGTHNYFIGNDKSKWRTDVPAYGEVFYKDVYAGIDLKFYAKNGTMEYDFIVHPGGNPEKIDVAFEGIDGMKVAQNGDLLVRTAFGEIRQKAPHIYQMVEGAKVEIAGGFRIKHTETAKLNKENNISYGFKLDTYNKQYALVIDPALVYSTFMGGSLYDGGYGIAVDSSGSAYVAGYTTSTDFPMTAIDTTYNGGNYDVFVFKINSSGNAIVYSTYLGGSDEDNAYGIAVDRSGNAYVAGLTQSTDFPTPNGIYTTQRGNMFDAFVFKINSSGNEIVYSTYLGGSGDDKGYAIAVDSVGNVYVTGETNSSDFPVVNAYQDTKNASSDIFVTKINSSGSAIVYSTYFGGSGGDGGRAIAVDSSGNMYVTGYTQSSTNFPIVNAIQSTYGGGSDDAFVFKLNSTGDALVYSTYLGGSSGDNGLAIAADNFGNAYITGYTWSSNFPVVNGMDAYGSSQDAFVTKINSSGSAVVYSTYLGGAGQETGYGIAVDSFGNAYVTGETNSADFPAVNALYPVKSYSVDAFVFKINSNGNAVIYSTFLGGGGNHEYGFAIAVDSFGNAYVTGETNSDNFPLENAIQSTRAGDSDSFVTKLGPIGKCVSKPVKISQTSVEYDTIQAAYSAATNTNHTILVQADVFTGPMSFSSGKRVSVTGGYGCDFIMQTGYSLITDSVTIGGAATVVMGNVIIK
jgi:hypothetical protein